MSRRNAATPKRRKKSAASRFGRFWILALVLAFVAAVGGYLAATWSGFEPKKIAVTGNGQIPVAQIVAAAKIDPARNLWLQDARAIAKRVEAIPTVGTADVHRGLPASVTIAVSLRKPAMTVLAPGAPFVVDHELRALYRAGDAVACPCVVPNKPLAVRIGGFVTDPQIVAMRDDLDALAAAHVEVAKLSYDKYENLTVALVNGPVVLLGDDGEDLQKKIALIGPIRAQLAKGRPIAAIDLRAPGTPVVKYR